MRWLLIICLFLVSCSANDNSFGPGKEGGGPSIYTSTIELESDPVNLYPGNCEAGDYSNFVINSSPDPGMCFDLPSPEYARKGFVDSSALSCETGYYKLLDNKDYVLHFPASVELDFGNCLEMKIDSGISRGIVELLVYKKGEANLVNHCGGCVMIGNINGKKIHRPQRCLSQCEGQVFIGKSGFMDYVLAQKVPRLTFYIPRLTFFDEEAKQEITIENQWIWQVRESDS